MAFVKAATVGELAPGTAKQLTVSGRTVGLFNINGTYHAIDDTCTHRGGPLSQGVCEGTEVTCPWHGARFDVTTGAHLSPPAPCDVAAYKVQVVGNEIQIDVP